MIRKRKMNTIVNITGLTLKCLEKNEKNVIKKTNRGKYFKEYYLKNINKFRKKKKNYLLKNPEYNREYYLKNKETILKKNKIYWNKNIENIKKYQKERYEINKKEINRKKYLNKKERLKNDFVFKLTQLLRRRILLALKGKNKSANTMKLLGVDNVEQVWDHLKKSFKPGMTKENHGKWHMDHIRPCSSFDLSKPEEQAKCFHYTNLQALWAYENLSKSDKYVA